MEEIKKNQIQNFIDEFESYLKKFFQIKELNNKPNEKIIIDGKPHSENIKTALKNFEIIYKDLIVGNQDVKIAIEFIKDKILLQMNLFSYEEKMQFMKLILDKNNDNKSNINIIEELLKAIEKNDKITFKKKDDYKFYEYLFLNINYLNKILEYSENEIISINKCDLNILNSNHLNAFFRTFLNQTNNEIIKEMSHLLYQIYNFNYEQNPNNNLLDKLIQSIKNYIMNNNFPCMKLLEYIIEQKEKSYIIIAKSHELLSKKELVRIKIIKVNKEQKENNEKNEEYFYFYENNTIFEILNFIKEKDNNFSYLILYDQNIIDKKDYNKTLREITKDKKSLTIIQKEIKKEKLIENGNLTEKLYKILKNIFNQFSNGKGFMDNEDIRKYVSIVKHEELTKESMKIIDLLKRFSSALFNRTLKENEFINIYYSKLNKEEDKSEKIVWENLHDLGYNYNLEKEEILNILENNQNMRYYLSNKINNEKIFLDELREKHKETNDINLLNFILFLSTNNDSYFNLLETDFSKPENKFTSKPKNYIDNMYNLIAIESIIEDLEINYLKNEENYKNKIYENKSSPFTQEGMEEKKKNFFINFIKNDYIDLIEYISSLFKNLNENGINDLDISPKLCFKGLDIINDLYASFYEAIFIKSSNDYIKINSPNELIKENKIENCIINWENYKNLIEQIMIFINKYYLKSKPYDNSESFINNLIEKCYFLLFYLIFSNNDFYDYINNTAQNKNISNQIFQAFLINNKTIISQMFFWTNKIKNKNISSKFLIDIIDNLFSLLKIINQDDFNKIISNDALSPFISAVFNYYQAINYYDKFKLNLIDIYNNTYNLLKSNDILNLSEIISTNIIRNIKILKKFSLKAKNLKEEIVNTKINNEQTLYELIIELFLSLEKNKLKEEKTKFLKFKESIESSETKFISYNDIFNEVNEEEKNDIKENKLFEVLYNYCSWCYYSIKQNQNEKMKYLFDKCEEVKNLENENIEIYKSLEKNNEPKIVRKKYRKYTGLKNISNTCYLNSVIQILFMIPEFRFLILSLNDGREQIKGEYLEDENMLHQLQKLFTFLLLTSQPFIMPRDFYLSLRDPNSILFADLNGQKDSQEFFLYLCDKLETLIKPISEIFD